MAKKTINVDDIELAINEYLETNSLDVFNSFKGKCKGLEPYGEKELGDAINSGNFETIRNTINKLSNFADSSDIQQAAKEDTRSEWQKDYDEAENQSNKDIDRKRDYLKNVKKLADKNKKSVVAQRDSLITDAKLKSLADGKDKKYLEDKKNLAKTYIDTDKLSEDANKGSIVVNNSEKPNGDIKMEISKKDLTKIMNAMKTINKHFAEEAEDEVENQVVEDEVDDTEDEDEVEPAKVEVVELPEDIADAVREALESSKEDVDDTEEDEEEEVVEDDSEDEVAEEEDDEEFCGETDFSEFHKFSEAITETIVNLNKKADKISKQTMDSMDDFIESFSEKDFRNFAEAVTTTLENIQARVDAIEAKSSKKDEITTNLDALKQTGDDYEEDFITKSDDPTGETKAEVTVENPDVGVMANAEVQNYSERLKTVKDFFSL